MTTYKEKELLSRIAEGEEEAFTTLFYNYLGRLKGFVSKYAASPEDARELIQETFVRLWINRDKLPQVENPAAYIFRIAANQYQLQLRKNLSQQRAVEGYKNVFRETPVNTDQPVRLKELQQLIDKAISQLPAQRRKIFLMSRQEGKTFQEIATELNLSPKTVKNTVFTALGHIRSYLAAAGETGWCWIFFLCCL